MPKASHAHADHPAVVSVLSKDKHDEAQKLAALLLLLRRQGLITDMGEAAILLPSVKPRHSRHYVDALTHLGVPVHVTHDERFADKHEPFDDAPLRSTARVIITTIHQAKGREWPVVCVGNLHSADMRPDELESQLGPHLTRWSAEPPGRAAMFDLARQHYVAFSRAQRMLIFSASVPPHPLFTSVLDGVPGWADADLRKLSGPRVGKPSGFEQFNARQRSVEILVPRRGVLTLRPSPNSALYLEYRTRAK